MEFADGQGGSPDAAGRNDSGDARSVREAGIEQGLLFVDFVAQRASNVPDRDLEIPFRETGIGDFLEFAAALDEDPAGTIHHDFRDSPVEDQMLDRAEE